MSPPRVHVFVGPSIPAERVRQALPDAEIHAPVEHGSLLRLDLHRGDTVAIIDGVFLQRAAVRHKELLHVLGEGVSLYGASSMGALRAAELAPYGLRGVGLVYRLLAAGLLERDDEVAVVHATHDDGDHPLSEALVNIRVAARRARRRGAITPDAERLLVRTAAAMPFPRRRFRAVAAAAVEAGLPRPAADRFLGWVADERPDVKLEDAERLLRLLRRTDRAAPIATMVAPVARTAYLDHWLQAAERDRAGDAGALTCYQLFAADCPAVHRRAVLRAIAGVASTSVHDGELEALALGAARRRGLLRPGAAALPPSFAEWLDGGERRLAPERAALLALVRSFRWEPGVAATRLVVEALRDDPVFAAAREHAATVGRFNRELAARDPRYRPERIGGARVDAWFARHWTGDGAVDRARFDLALLDRGFASRAAFRELARPYLPHAVLEGPPPLRPRGAAG